MRYLLLIFIIISSTGLLGQNTVRITGQFAYSPNQTFSIFQLANPLVQKAQTMLYEGQSDARSFFEAEFELAETGIVYLDCVQDQLQLYLGPGDSLDLEIVNRFSVKYSGGAATLNAGLKSIGLGSNRYPFPFNVDDYELNLGLYYLDTLQEHQQKLIAHLKAPTDYLNFVQAECLGMRHLMLNRLYRRAIRQPDDQSMLVPIELELSNLELLEETRSDLYLDAQLQLHTKGETANFYPVDDLASWEKRYQSIKETFQDSPVLQQLLLELIDYLSIRYIFDSDDWDRYYQRSLDQSYSSPAVKALITAELNSAGVNVQLGTANKWSLSFEEGETNTAENHLGYPLFIYLLESKKESIDSLINELQQVRKSVENATLLIIQYHPGAVHSKVEQVAKGIYHTKLAQWPINLAGPKLLFYDETGALSKVSDHILPMFFLRRR